MNQDDYDILSREHEDFERARYQTPYWYDPKSKPCEHVKQDVANAQVVNHHDGSSDSGFTQYECKVCKHKFSRYIEG